jgi:hypothetical protein
MSRKSKLEAAERRVGKGSEEKRRISRLAAETGWRNLFVEWPQSDVSFSRHDTQSLEDT